VEPGDEPRSRGDSAIGTQPKLRVVREKFVTGFQIIAKKLVWVCGSRKLLDQECVALEKSVSLMAG
jgi:hypothetical protein